MAVCNGQLNGFRFTNKNKTSNERNLFAGWWSELTALYGTYVDYYVHGYALSAHDAIYGEHPTACFWPPSGMIVLAEMSNDSVLLSRFGLQTDADLTVVIPIQDFRNVFGQTAEPKSGDLIKLSELGWDRPGAAEPYPPGSLSGTDACSTSGYSTEDGLLSGTTPEDSWIRGPNIYEITERRDDNVPAHINMLQGHYVWLIKCKRFDYSYECNAPREAGSNQVSDETLYGKLSGGTPVAEPPKRYPQNAEQLVKDGIWDYDAHGHKDSTYGSY